MLGQAQHQADNGFTNLTVGFASDNYATNDKAWRRFDLNPVLRIQYNSPPLPPSDRSMERGLLPCREGGIENRVYVPTRTPRMRAKVEDPDGGVLSSDFWVGKPGRLPVTVASYHVNDTPSGSYAEAQVQPGAITEDGAYYWNASTSDGELTGAWPTWLGDPVCRFIVDTVKPVVPETTSVEYPASTPGVASV